MTVTALRSQVGPVAADEEATARRARHPRAVEPHSHSAGVRKAPRLQRMPMAMLRQVKATPDLVRQVDAAVETSLLAKDLVGAASTAAGLEAARAATGVALVATAADSAAVTARPSPRVVSVSRNGWAFPAGMPWACPRQVTTEC